MNAGMLKLTALLALIVQSTSLVLCMRYTRTVHGGLYLSSTAVILSELLKCAVCVLVMFAQQFEENSDSALGDDNDGREKGKINNSVVRARSKRVSFGRACEKFNMVMYTAFVVHWRDWLKLAVPASLYALQNNLLYFALSHLDAAVYQVTYQLKVFTTAAFSVLLLRRRLSPMQWFALTMLMTGVVIVQLNAAQTQTSSSNDDEYDAAAAALAAHAEQLDGDNERRAVAEQQPLLGLVAVLVACMTSGGAGVYFEKILKGSSLSLWMRNIQLSVFGLTFSLLLMWINDAEQLAENGSFFYGYSAIVWLVVVLQAIGGLVIAVVVKYADNILKAFASSISIILSSIISTLLFDFSVTVLFALGAVLVVASTYIYNEYPPAKLSSVLHLPK
jgi:solute carrier family 35 (UDP-sugar transporter), member A1/2/3